VWSVPDVSIEVNVKRADPLSCFVSEITAAAGTSITSVFGKPAATVTRNVLIAYVRDFVLEWRLGAGMVNVSFPERLADSDWLHLAVSVSVEGPRFPCTSFGVLILLLVERSAQEGALVAGRVEPTLPAGAPPEEVLVVDDPAFENCTASIEV
jgi:hypothetical protein